MGKQLGTGTVVAILVIVVVVLGLVAYRMFGPARGGAQEDVGRQAEQDMMRMQRGGAGQVPPGTPMPGGR